MRRSQSHIQPWTLNSRILRRQTTSTCAEATTEEAAVPAAFALLYPARFPATAAFSHARAKRSFCYTMTKRRGLTTTSWQHRIVRRATAVQPCGTATMHERIISI
ncbi:hypothetical protein V8C42DRAFT_324342 [Trichoderma barbatum]